VGENLKRRQYFGYLGVDWMIILKRNWDKEGVNTWIEMSSLRIRRKDSVW